jgi:hypothetical protein
MAEDEAEVRAEIELLQRQQAMQTNALRAALEARWSGEDSVDAWVRALDPGLTTTTPRTPIYEDD